MSWKPTPSVKLLAAWTAYLLVFSWLPLVRCTFDGESYRWGTSHFGASFSAAGIGADLWLPAFKAIVLVYLLWGLLRGAGAVHRWSLVGWNLAWFVDALLSYRRDPDAMMFHGDTLGIHLNLGLVVPASTGLFFALALLWALRESKRSDTAPRPGWTDRNRRLLAGWTLLLPLQFLLLRFGAPHGTTDAIGVLLTIAQCPLLLAAFYPWKVAGRGRT